MKGKIYKIINSVDNEFYIGSTINALAVRMRNHRYRSKDETRTSKLYTLMRKYGVDKFEIELLEEIECKDKNELELYEKDYIKTLNATQSLNHTIIKQTPKEYYDSHREQRINKAKQHYEKNKERKLALARAYRENNKESIKQYKQEYRQDNKDKIAKQQQDFYNNNKDKIKQYKHDYYIKNKEKLTQQFRQYYLKNKVNKISNVIIDDNK